LAVTVEEDGPENGDDGGEGQAGEIHKEMVGEDIDENRSKNRHGERSVTICEQQNAGDELETPDDPHEVRLQ